MKKQMEVNILLLNSRYIDQKEYWINKLSGDIEETKILMEHKADGKPQENRGKINISINEPISGRLIKLGKNADLAIYIILLAGLKALIYRYSGNGDVSVLSPLNKFMVSEETLNNCVFIRDRVDGDMTFKELILEVKQSLLQGYENQDYPSDMLMEYLYGQPQELNNNCISNIVCSLNSLHDFGNVEEINGKLSFFFIKEDGRLSGSIIYKSGTYEPFYIQQISNHLVQLLDQAAADVNVKVADIPILSEMERKTLLEEFNDNKADFSQYQAIPRLIETNATTIPDNIAVSCEDSIVTYRALNRAANQLARMLKNKGIGKDQPVGILLNRSLSMITSILAVWKAGGAYIPIDPQYPVNRIMEILTDSDSKALLTKSKTIAPGIYDAFPGHIIVLDKDEKVIKNQDAYKPPNMDMDMNNLAYIIYTSGSTGKPKGAMVEHIGMMNHMQAKINDLQLTGKSIVAQNASHTFDISVWQFFAALIPGGKTVIYPNDIAQEPERLISRVINDGITILEVVPSYLSVILEYVYPGRSAFASLAYLLVTGETLKANLVRQWFEKYPEIKMVNAYGPTEASDDITHHIMDKPPGSDRIPIGKPLLNFNIYIVDKQMNLCPIGVKGDILVSGIGVGRGYLKDDKGTEDVFMEDPFSGQTGLRLYKTGDLGRWLPDGTIEFFGRKDYQVKIRGFRIELGEIESKLVEHEAVKEAVVLDREDQWGNRFLCAYITADGNMDTAMIKAHLLESLPEYMVPAYFLELETIPLTVNGKIDRKALKQKEININSTQEYIKPRDKVEEKLVEIWSTVLGIEKNKVSINANFFEQGGHSLKATVLAATIYKELKVKLSLAEIFKVPLVMELAQYIKQAARDSSTNIEKAEKKEYYVLSPAQKGLYFIQTFDPGSISFNIPQVLLLEGTLEIEKFEAAFKKLIDRHESLRTSFDTAADQPVQRIHDNVNFHLQYCETGESEAKEILKDFVKPFDLGKVPLMRVKLIKIGMNRYILMVDIHHIISDAISQDIFMKDFMTFYMGGEPPQLPIHYKDFSEWQDKLNKSGVLKKQEAYWLNRFKDDIPVLNMNTDYPRPLLKRFDGGCIDFEIESELSDRVRRFITETGVTMYIFLLAVYTIVLSKYSDQEDIVVGSPFSSRTHVNLYNIIGLLVNMLPMRNSVNDDMTFSQFLMEVKGNALDAFENQDYQFTELVRNLNTQKDTSRHPLFDNVFALNNIIGAAETIKNLNFKVNGYMQQHVVLKFDLLLDAFDNGEGAISMSLSYAKSLYKQSTVEIITRHYLEILEKVIEEKDAKIKKITLSHDLLAAELINPQLKEFSFSF